MSHMAHMAHVFRVQPGQVYVDNQYGDRYLVVDVLNERACLESEEHGRRIQMWQDLSRFHTDGQRRSTGYNLATT